MNRSSWIRRSRRIVAALLVGYALLVTFFGVFQHSLIYFPTRSYELHPSDAGLPFEPVMITTADGESLASWLIPAQDAQATVLFFHGNGGNISHRLHAAQILHQLGYTILLVDYRGYGQSTGKPSEAGLYRDAQAAWDYLTRTRGQTPGRIVLFGESLGGAVAVELASRHEPGALVLESTFTSLGDVGAIHYSYLPVRMLLRDRYDSLSRIGKISAPKIFLHGRDDLLVPMAMGRELYQAAAPPKEFIETPGDHNDAGFTYSPEVTRQFALRLAAALNGRP